MIKKTGKSGEHLSFSDGRPDPNKKTGESKTQGASGLTFQEIRPKEQPQPTQTR